ncbi:hypothetical protein [Thalassoroseus pseudoceratinae]|uniref:hypothetical protein n=1 Tax=Thalassoroseus pseudoceratinae TaxID=2713176 RepID=UPI0014211BD7|nr:hypothetical protein [Thalassoroseus pseudoceratinae]
MIAQFAARLIFGMSFTWVCLPQPKISSGFFRIQMLVVLGLGVLGSLTGNTEETIPTIASSAAFLPLFIVISVLAFLGSVFWTLERRQAGCWFGYAIAAISLATVVLFAARPETSFLENLFRVDSEAATSLILGVTMVAMLLGHWYLTAPTMSHDPLLRANQLFAIAVLIRFVMSAIALALNWQLVGSGATLTWLALRWIAGILGPAVLAVMVWRILKYRNTQSATGVLFVGVILTFIGELSATLLTRELGVPF